MMREDNQNNENDVKEESLRQLLSGRKCRALQLMPDHQQAPEMKVTKTLKTATWNVRTFLQKGKLKNVKKEIERLNNILGISEV